MSGGLLNFPDPPPDVDFAGGSGAATGLRLARSGDGRLTVAFEGTIYNRAALQAGGLRASGQGGDEDLMLALYARHGPACVERLRGPFALAVWEGDACLLVRDKMGLKALYYFHDETAGRLTFATGVRPLAASGVAPRELDARAVYGFFRYGAVPGSLCLPAGVRALAPGERLRWNSGRVTRELFQTPPRLSAAGNAASPAEQLRAVLLDSVEHHLADGLPTAVFVGGGAGSAALLALARAAGRTDSLRALTIGFDDPALDETDRARRVAEHFGVRHTHLRLDRERAQAWFDDFVTALDQPAIHGFPLFALGRFAREEGVKVTLAGIGAHELFGSARFHAHVADQLRLSLRLGGMRGPVSRLLAKMTTHPGRQRLADFLARPPTLMAAYAAVRGIDTAAEARALTARFADPTGCAEPLPEESAADGSDALDLRRPLRDQRLRDADVLSRAQGLEMRLPFVDAEVMETLARVLVAVPLRERHRLLREAVPEIAPWVTRGWTSGLCFPLKEWRAADWAKARPADAVGRQTPRTWEQRWSLFLLRQWRRQFTAG